MSNNKGDSNNIKGKQSYYHLMLSGYDDEEDNIKPKRKFGAAWITSIIVLVVIFTAFSASVIYTFAYPNIFYGVVYDNINLGGLTYQQAQELLVNQLGEQYGERTVNLLYDDKKEQLKLKDINFNVDFEKMAALSYNIGREGGFIKRYSEAIGGIFAKKNINASFAIDEKKLDEILSGMASKYDVPVKQPGYTADDKSIIITKGTDGKKLDLPTAKQNIKNNFLSLKFDDIVLPVAVEKAKDLDLDGIYKEFYKQPENATIKVTGKDSYDFTEGTDGESFNLQSVKDQFAAGAATVTVDIEYTRPGITVDDLKTLTFSNLLGSYTSNLDASLKNRTTNVALATKACDGVILMPGEEFSFNKVVGPRTYERGYKDAFIYVGNEVVEGLGGGICQVSSTLYAAVLKSELQVVERKNHKFTVSYMPLGADATVYYGSTDFRFKNNTDYPILIKGKQVGSTCSIEIWGTETRDYTVSLSSVAISKTPYKTIKQETTDLAPGKTKLKQAGHSGYTSEIYLVKTDKAGKQISRTLITKDKYIACDQIYLVGKSSSTSTGSSTKPTSTATPAPTHTSTPTATPTPTKAEEDSNHNGIPDWLET